MSTDTTRSGHCAAGRTDQTEDAVVDALGQILSRSEAARCALESTLREGGTAVGTLAGVRSLDIGMEWERPCLAGYDDEGAVRVLINAMCWTDLTRIPAEWVFQAWLPLGPARGAAVRCAGGAAGIVVAGVVSAGG